MQYMKFTLFYVYILCSIIVYRMDVGL